MNYWSENGDILVHENRGTTMIAGLLLLAGTLLIPFVATGWVAVAACLAFWTVFGLEAMTTATRVEFDRTSRTLRQRNVLGLKSTDRLDRFACVQVFRATSFRGYPLIRVNLKPDGGHGDGSEYVVAIYGVPGEASEKAAREWGERLARFLKIPLNIDL